MNLWEVTLARQKYGSVANDHKASMEARYPITIVQKKEDVHMGDMTSYVPLWRN